jgi:predicted NBD/HSP70 family sugar kinase
VDRLIVASVRDHGPSTRTEIARRAELSKSTVTEHVQVLLRRRVLVERTHTLSGQRGRPARVLDLPAGVGVSVALVLSHGEVIAQGPVQCAVVAVDGVASAYRLLPPGDRPILRGVHELERMLADEGLGKAAVRCAVLGVPLPLDLSKGDDVAPVGPDNEVIASMAQLLGARPHDALTRAFGVRAWLGNDADLAALGEAGSGAGKGAADLAFLMCVNGGGVGIVRGGQLITGGRVTAGETEHVQVEGGVPCVCGASSCSGDGEPRPLWARLHRWGIRPHSMEQLAADAEARDPQTIEALRGFGEALGRGLSALHLVFQPAVIVLEAQLGAAYPPLAAGLERAVSLSAPPWARVPTKVALAQAWPSSAICGAAAVADTASARGGPSGRDRRRP